MIDFTGIKGSPIGMVNGSMGAGAAPAAAFIARGQAVMAEFVAGRAARAQAAPTAARAARRQAAPKASPAPATASRPASTPEQRRVDALGYPASWTENGQEAIAAARAAAPGGAGVDYPASWRI